MNIPDGAFTTNLQYAFWLGINSFITWIRSRNKVALTMREDLAVLLENIKFARPFRHEEDEHLEADLLQRI
jgi:hypothetical protein